MAQMKMKDEVGPAKTIRSSPQEAENKRWCGKESQEERKAWKRGAGKASSHSVEGSEEKTGL